MRRGGLLVRGSEGRREGTGSEFPQSQDEQNKHWSRHVLAFSLYVQHDKTTRPKY